MLQALDRLDLLPGFADALLPPLLQRLSCGAKPLQAGHLAQLSSSLAKLVERGGAGQGRAGGAWVGYGELGGENGGR